MAFPDNIGGQLDYVLLSDIFSLSMHYCTETICLPDILSIFM